MEPGLSTFILGGRSGREAGVGEGGGVGGGGAGGAAFSSSAVAPGHIIGQNAL